MTESSLPPLRATPGRVSSWEAAARDLSGVLPLRFLVVAAVVAGVLLGLTGGEGRDLGSAVALLFPLIVTGGLTRGIVSADREPGRWLLLFQRPLSPERYYTSKLVIVCAISVALLAVGGIAATLTGLISGSSEFRLLWGEMAGGAILTIQLVVIAAGVSAWSRRHDVELLLLLFFVSVFQAVLWDVEWLARMESLLQYLLLPVPAIFNSWNFLARGRPLVLTSAEVIHGILYPLAWFGLLLVGVRRLRSQSFPAR